tara:strand:+ start:185 stop:523 length:339 start_codon:yes stop_codon:yes gene_type:complete
MKIDYTSKWLLQKALALLFLIASIYTFFSLKGLELKNYESFTFWFKSYLNSFSILVLFTSIFLHSNIGLTSIIDDYIHEQSSKKRILIVKNFFFVVLFLITIFSLIRLVFYV